MLLMSSNKYKWVNVVTNKKVYGLSIYPYVEDIKWIVLVWFSDISYENKRFKRSGVVYLNCGRVSTFIDEIIDEIIVLLKVTIEVTIEVLFGNIIVLYNIIVLWCDKDKISKYIKK